MECIPSFSKIANTRLTRVRIGSRINGARKYVPYRRLRNVTTITCAMKLMYPPLAQSNHLIQLYQMVPWSSQQPYHSMVVKSDMIEASEMCAECGYDYLIQCDRCHEYQCGNCNSIDVLLCKICDKNICVECMALSWRMTSYCICKDTSCTQEYRMKCTQCKCVTPLSQFHERRCIIEDCSDNQLLCSNCRTHE